MSYSPQSGKQPSIYNKIQPWKKPFTVLWGKILKLVQINQMYGYVIKLGRYLASCLFANVSLS